MDKKHRTIFISVIGIIAICCLLALFVITENSKIPGQASRSQRQYYYGAWDDESKIELSDLPSEDEYATWVEELMTVVSIPRIDISVEQEVINRDYVLMDFSATDSIVAENNYMELSGSIRPRGNTTYRIGKNYGVMPYKIKLDHAENLLGMGESKKWCLIPNFFDKSYVKQFVAYQVAQLVMGSSYFQPQAKFVELYMNGNYAGLYLLTESIEEDEGRLDLEVSDNKEKPPFLLEMANQEYVCTSNGDNFVGDSNLIDGFYADWNGELTRDDFGSQSNELCEYTPYYMKYPESMNAAGDAWFEQIKSTMKNYYYAIENGLLFEDLPIDAESHINYWIFTELFSLYSFLDSSLYVYAKPGTNIVTMGPLWDFDCTLFGYTNFFLPYEDNTIYRGLFEYSSFRNAITERFNLLSEKLFPSIEDAIEKLSQNQILKNAVLKSERHHNTWGREIIGYFDPEGNSPFQNQNILALNTFEAHVGYVKDWLFSGYVDSIRGALPSRVDWIKDNINSWGRNLVNTP